jgi:hypothetical protein
VGGGEGTCEAVARENARGQLGWRRLEGPLVGEYRMIDDLQDDHPVKSLKSSC